MKKQRNKAGAIYIGEVLTIVAIVLSVSALGVAFMRPPQKGDTGPIGLQGIQGEQGLNGPQGVLGPTGPTGPAGPKGVNGSNGAPYVNHPPSMNVTALTGSYKDLDNYTRFTFNITVKTHDADNDTVQSYAYYRFGATELWKPAYVWFALNTTTSASITIDLLSPSNTRIYWALQAWDGCELTMKYVNYLVVYP